MTKQTSDHRGNSSRGAADDPRPLPGRRITVSAMSSFLAIFCLGAVLIAPSQAQEGAQAAAVAEFSVTQHAIGIAGETLDYTATTGVVEVATRDEKARGEVFFTAYTRDGASAQTRPVTFVFNGGPGAASAYLHLLALGPRILALGAEGTIPPPPARLVENPQTWLSFTDLVFIDPIGTGFSQATPPEDAESRDGGAERFWDLERDLDAVAEFIRLHLTRSQRWQSPKFLVGESYGGFRAAALPARLADHPGIRLNGVVLVSPVLEFNYLEFGAYRLQPWASILPAYAATARYHGKTEGSRDVESLAAEVEAFASGAYLPWLLQDEIGEDDPEFATLVRYLGLPESEVARMQGRVSRTTFAKMLLRDSRQVISLYDSTIAGPDPHPGSSRLRGQDPVLDGLTAPLTTAFNSYIRDELAYETDRAYRVLNPEVSRNWNWQSGGRARPRAPGAADSLKEAMALNRGLKVFIVHGHYDLVTPPLASRLVVQQMRLAPALRRNLTFETYAGGHMPYTHESARAALFEDARSFFRDAVPERADTAPVDSSTGQ